jgi:hypothetical protein
MAIGVKGAAAFLAIARDTDCEKFANGIALLLSREW